MYEQVDSSFVYGEDVYIPEEYMDEKWSYIKGIPGYMISDKGRVWSRATQSFLKLKRLDSHGHVGVCLYCRGARHYEYIHRLMAEAFIPNPHHYPIVRHLDDDPTNNELYNLAWGTQADNMRDAKENGRSYTITNADREKGLRGMRTPIIATNISTGKTRRFKGQGAASRCLHIPQGNIWKVLKGERRMAKGYRFEYERGAKNERD